MTRNNGWIPGRGAQSVRVTCDGGETWILNASERGFSLHRTSGGDSWAYSAEPIRTNLLPAVRVGESFTAHSPINGGYELETVTSRIVEMIEVVAW